MDNIKITILEDGTIKTETDKVSAPNHSNAENFLSNMAKMAGGETKRRRRGAAEAHGHHTHEHGETHTH